MRRPNLKAVERSVSMGDKILPTKLSDNLQRVEDICKRQGVKFEDPSFGAISSDELPNGQGLPEMFWANATNVIGSEAVLFGSIAPENLLRGILSGSYFHSAICCLAEKPVFVRRLFSMESISERGVYGIWINKEGGWQEITIDEAVPVFIRSNGVQFAGTQSIQKEIWPLLLEKAYAKAWGSYKKICSGNSINTLRDLTGAPYTIFQDFQDLQLLWDRLIAARDRRWLLVASTTALSPVVLGLERDKLYCIKDLQNVSDHLGRSRQILRVADPAKTMIWKGPWGRGTIEWTSKFEFLCDTTDQTFWIGLEDFVRLFDTLGVFMLEHDFFADSLKLSLESSNRQLISFSLNQKETDLTISVDQQDKRSMLDVEGYSFSYLRISVAKLSDNDILFVDARLSCQKSVFISDALPEGTYLALIEVYLTASLKLRDVTIGVYSSNQVELTTVDLASCLFSQVEYNLWNDFAANNKQAFIIKNENETYEA